MDANIVLWAGIIILVTALCIGSLAEAIVIFRLRKRIHGTQVLIGELISWFLLGGLTKTYKKLLDDPSANLTGIDKMLYAIVTLLNWAAITGIVMIIFGLTMV